MRILKENPILSIVNGMLVDLPAPSNISWFWGFGSLLGLCLILQIATGVFLAMHYVAHADLAFNSVEHIMRDVNYGWAVRYAHANGASMFFIIVYIHIARGLYYGSYAKPREAVWSVGVVILIVMMATAFMGYCLVWGAMSFWGVTVITNLLSAIPVVGQDIVEFVWGGYSVGNPTLNRFFSLHYLLPFVLAGLAVVHLIALHTDGSNNPLGVDTNIDKVPFHPYYSIKDIFGYVIFGMVYAYLIFFAPNALGHPDNYIMANPLVTPEHIQPEFYFLFAYAILRSIPNKLLGVIALFVSLLILLIAPYVEQSQIRSKQFRPISKWMYWVFVGDFMILTYIGGQVVEEPFVTIGQVASVFYFLYFIVINPVIGKIENRITGGERYCPMVRKAICKIDLSWFNSNQCLMRIPKGVEIRQIGENVIYVRGKMGIQKAIVEGVKVIGEEIETVAGEGRETIRRMIQGVKEGYKGRLKINGVGYRAVTQEGKVKLTIGYKDEKIVKIGEGVKIEITGNGTIITGRSARNEELQGTLSRIREVRAARKDKYKGKGIK